QVVVRCRPLNTRELTRGAKELVRMVGNQTIIDPPEEAAQAASRATERKQLAFTFDKSYWSACDRNDPR
ncbi:hypothetical protein EXIGLDRAFT_597751, partial [Exidia glandulosa HHB12029]